MNGERRSIGRNGPRPGSASRGGTRGGRFRLDRLDVAILRALQQDGRASFRQVARSVRASVTTVSTRVRRLRRLGVLTGFVPLVDAQRLSDAGRTLCCLFCSIRPSNDDPTAVARLAERIGGFSEICYIFEVASHRELIALASTPSVEAGRALVARLAALKGVESLTTAPIERVHKERPRHPIPAVRFRTATPPEARALTAPG